MKSLAVLAAAVASIALLTQPASAKVHTYKTEAGAQKHCPTDTVVWLNTSSGIYHMKGERYYGTTKTGSYVCQKEADTAGDKASANDQ